MKIQIITIGKKHDKNLESYIFDFEKRIKTYFDLSWVILDSTDNKNKDIQIKEESLKILQKLKKEQAFIILLEESGQEKSTAELVNLFEEKMNTSIDKIIFIIGGAYGVNEEVKSRANLALSLSKLIFPHQLVRAILIEQIYRITSILKNSKYHHE